MPIDRTAARHSSPDSRRPSLHLLLIVLALTDGACCRTASSSGAIPSPNVKSPPRTQAPERSGQAEAAVAGEDLPVDVAVTVAGTIVSRHARDVGRVDRRSPRSARRRPAAPPPAAPGGRQLRAASSEDGTASNGTTSVTKGPWRRQYPSSAVTKGGRGGMGHFFCLPLRARSAID
jgi:hypothetical protein